MKCLVSRTICAGKLLLLAWLVLISPAGAGTVARLRETATVKDGTIRLGEVAQIAGDRATCARLSAIELGPSPLPGHSRGLEADYIRIRLRQQKLDPAILTADSPRECRITRSCQKLSSDQLIETARKFLEANLEPGEGRLEIEAVSHPRELILPEGTLELSCDFIGSTAGGSSRRVMVKADVGGVPCNRVDISLRVRRFARVAVARAIIPKGESLTAERVGYVERDRMALPEGTILESEPLEGLQAQMTISTGALITRRLISDPTVVHRGDEVTVLVRTGGILISTPGIATENGSIDKTIRVRNTLSNLELRAKVLDAKTVEASL